MRGESTRGSPAGAGLVVVARLPIVRDGLVRSPTKRRLRLDAPSRRPAQRRRRPRAPFPSPLAGLLSRLGLLRLVPLGVRRKGADPSPEPRRGASSSAGVKARRAKAKEEERARASEA